MRLDFPSNLSAKEALENIVGIKYSMHDNDVIDFVILSVTVILKL